VAFIKIEIYDVDGTRTEDANIFVPILHKVVSELDRIINLYSAKGIFYFKSNSLLNGFAIRFLISISNAL